LIGGHEILLEIGCNIRVGQGDRPELLGVVSGKPRLGKVSRNMNQKDKFSFTSGSFRCLFW
jgi:hypothetical protein